MAALSTVEKLRADVYAYRKDLLKLCNHVKGLHIGGDMSCAEVMVTLFQYVLHVDPKNPGWADRDRFVLSKGHCSAALYLVMAQRGYFDKQELFDTYKNGYETRFGNHPCKAALPCLDSSSGSLGHGLPIAAGMAAAAKLDGKTHRVYCVLGDGELSEGSIWEAALAAAGFKLGNLVAIVDRNKMGLDGFTEEILPLNPVEEKWKAFNWNVRVVDGHDLNQIVDAFDALPPADSDVPTVIIADTVKGKGVSFMENNPIYHHIAINDEQLAQALAEVEAAYQKGGIHSETV